MKRLGSGFKLGKISGSGSNYWSGNTDVKIGFFSYHDLQFIGPAPIQHFKLDFRRPVFAISGSDDQVTRSSSFSIQSYAALQ